MAKYFLLTVVLIGLVAATLGSPVASDDGANHDQFPDDMDGSEFFHAPYHQANYGYNYGIVHPLNVPFRAGYGGVPGVYPGVLNGGITHQHPFFYRK